MTAAVRVHQPGGPDALVYENVDVGAPGKGEIRMRQHACGVNFIDVYFRSGYYAAPSLPFIAGSEGAGEVTAVGEGVSDLKVGDRVAYAMGLGGYAQERLLAADRAVKIPDGISYEQAAAMMLKGMTACYLLRRTYKVEKGSTILMQAAAGGVGLLVCQWAKHLGATVIGTVGSKEKADLAKANGCDHTILYRDEDFAARVKDITNGKLCDVVYDGIGKATYPKSLDCLKPFGLFASFGAASGSIKDFDLNALAPKGSLYVTRPTLATHTAKREDLLDLANQLFAVVKSGVVKVEINQTYALKDVAQAHRDLEGRDTTGTTILIP
jgi:NADPH2:quinone reductase